MQKRDLIWNGFGVCHGVHVFLFVMILILIFSGMFMLTKHTPLQMDDYDYMFSWSTGASLSGFKDILASQKAHYMLWGGRSITHTLVQSFLYIGKQVFNFFNPLLYLCLLLEIGMLAGKKLRSFPWEVLLAGHLVLFFTIPFFGVTFLWLDGACNYLWGTVIALQPLIVLKSRANRGIFSRKGFLPLAMIIMFIGGWTNENTACGILMTHGLILIDRRISIEKWSFKDIILFLCNAAGVCLLLLAPGNQARAAKYTPGNLLTEYVLRFVRVAFYAFRYAFVPWIILAILVIRNKKSRVPSLEAHLGLMAAVFAILALVASPEVSDRTYLGVIVLLLSECFEWIDFRTAEEKFPRTAVVLTVVAILCTGTGIYNAMQAVKKHETMWNLQLEKIEMAVQAGDDEVEIQSVYSVSPYTMSILLDEDAGIWPNSTIGKWFHIRIRGVPEQEQR